MERLLKWIDDFDELVALTRMQARPLVMTLLLLAAFLLAVAIVMALGTPHLLGRALIASRAIQRTAGLSEYVPVSLASASTCPAIAWATCWPVKFPSTGQRARSVAYSTKW